uniref:Uncharacterized protein n=1 Tax=Solanum tuberosum TaxID=4113 RepID=M1DFS8_SOLTU
MQISKVAGGTDGHHPRTVGHPTVRSGGPWFTTCDPSPEPTEIHLSVDPRQDPRNVGQATLRGPRLAYTRNTNAKNANTTPLVPDQEVSCPGGIFGALQ